MNLSQLGPFVHALTALLPLAWNYAFHPSQDLSPGLILFCVLLGLLPDIDTQASYIGRSFPATSRLLERRYGHRSITHSLLAVLLLAVITRLLTLDWWLLSAAYASHLALDMIIGGRTGVMLLWPWQQRFNLLTIPAASIAELTIGIFAALFVIVPLTMPSTAVRIQSVLPVLPTFTPTPLPTFTPPPVPTLVSIKIEHVFDTAEILVSAGQPITKGALLADLTSQRATLTAPTIWDILPSPTPTRPATPITWIVPTLDPLVESAAVADLQSAIARATLAAAPPSINEITAACNRADSQRRQHEEQTQTACSKIEAMKNALWQDQLSRDALKSKANEPGSNIPWEQIGALEAGLMEQERQIAEQDLQCTNLQSTPDPDVTLAQSTCDALRNKPHDASPAQMAVAAADLQRAYVRYAQIMATPPSPTPRPTEPPAPTPTATPTADTHDTWVYSAVDGDIYAVNVVAMDGLASTVKIDIAIGWGIPISQSSNLPISPSATRPSPPSSQPATQHATVIHVRDGDTLDVQFSDGRQTAIRLLDVNTPETVKPNAPIECYGPEASHHTKERFQCDPNGNNCAVLEVQIEIAGTDKYGRTLGYVWLDGVLYNEELTAQGFALYNDYGEKHQHSETVEQAAATAQSQGLGLWGACPAQ